MLGPCGLRKRNGKKSRCENKYLARPTLSAFAFFGEDRSMKSATATDPRTSNSINFCSP